MVSIDYKIKKHKKIFFSEATRPTAYIFSMLQFIVVPYIRHAHHTTGVRIGNVPLVFSSKRLL